MSSVEERVKNIIVTQLGVKADEVKNESKFIDDLGADSLDTVELVMALEEEFETEIADDEASPKTGNVSSSDLRSKEITTAKRRLKIDILIRLILFSSIISNYCNLNE